MSTEKLDYIKEMLKHGLKVDNSYIISKENLNIVQEKINGINERITKLKKKGRIPESAPLLEIDIEILRENPIKNAETIVKRGTTYNKGESFSQNIEFKHLENIFDKIGDQIKSFLNVKVKNTTTQLSNWIIRGLISKSENGEHYTISKFTDKELPERFKDIENTNPCLCEHCNTNRDRNNTFIIENNKTNEVLQIGSSCMKDFVDEKDMKYFFITEEFGSVFDIDEDGFGYGGSERYTAVFDKEEYLATVSAYMNRCGGYKSNNNTFDGTLTTTKFVSLYLDEFLLDKYLNEIRKSLNYSGKSSNQINEIIKRERDIIESLEISENDILKAKSIIDKYKNISKEEIKKLNEFEFNMSVILSDNSDVLIGTSAPRVAYSVALYDKQKKLDETNKLKQELSEKVSYEVPIYFCQEKQKIESIEVMLVDYKSNYDEIYRCMNYIFKLKTLSGQDIYIKHSGEIDSLPKDFIDQESNCLMNEEVINNKFKGKYITLKGSVAENSDSFFMGHKIIRTKINRIKFDENFTEEPKTNGEIILNEKYNFGDFRIIREEKSSVINVDKLIDNYRYTLEDINGNQYYMITPKNKEEFKEGNTVSIIFQKGHDNYILPMKNEYIKIKDNLENNIEENITIKAAEKLLNPKEQKNNKMKKA